MRKSVVATRQAGAVPVLNSLSKTLTGGPGLDEITAGGLPKGRTTLARDASVDLLMREELDRKQLASRCEHKALEARIAAPRFELATEEREWRQISRQSAAGGMAKSRKGAKA